MSEDYDKRIAVLTGGGHVTSLNAGIVGVLSGAKEKNWQVYGALDGWEGMEQGNLLNLTEADVEAAHLRSKGGSELGSSRRKPNLEAVMETIEDYKIDGVVVEGGDDTHSVGKRLKEDYDVPVVGWPKTMDNDLSETYFCLGYPSAVKEAGNTLRDSIDMAATHNRIVIATMFGRHTDWVSGGSAAYGNADLVIPAEEEVDIEDIYDEMRYKYERNGIDNNVKDGFAVAAVSEGASIRGLDEYVGRDEDVLEEALGEVLSNYLTEAQMNEFGDEMLRDLKGVVKEGEDHDTDQFGNIKLNPFLLTHNLSSAIEGMSRDKGNPVKTAPMTLTYQLRNGSPTRLEEELGVSAGKECVRFLRRGLTGKMVGILYDNEFYVGPKDFEDVIEERKVSETDLIDYDNLEANEEACLDYLQPLLGGREERVAFLLDHNELRVR